MRAMSAKVNESRALKEAIAEKMEAFKDGKDREERESHFRPISAYSDDDSDNDTVLDMHYGLLFKKQLSKKMDSFQKFMENIRIYLYNQKLRAINAEKMAVLSGESLLYKQKYQALKEEVKVKEDCIKARHNLELGNIAVKCESDEMSAKQDLNNDISISRDKLMDDINERIRLLEEDNFNVDFHSSIWMREHGGGASGSSGASSGFPGTSSSFSSAFSSFPGTSGGVNNNTSGKGKKGTKRECSNRKPITMKKPYIVYQLTEEEIMEDWTFVMKELAKKKKMFPESFPDEAVQSSVGGEGKKLQE